MPVVPQSPYGPDLPLSNIYPFPKLKVIKNGGRYESAAERVNILQQLTIFLQNRKLKAEKIENAWESPC
jgi:hypothetical protein